MSRCAWQRYVTHRGDTTDLLWSKNVMSVSHVGLQLTFQMFRFWNLPSLYLISVNLTPVVAAGNYFRS